jgi:hypothetical protein
MDKLSHTPADTLHQADEDILTYTASDEVLEAAAGTERGMMMMTWWAGPQRCLIFD